MNDTTRDAADELRAAAAHIRDHAGAASPGTWRPETSWVFGGEARLPGIHEAVIVKDAEVAYNTVAITGFTGEHPDSAATAAHIALWHPPAALLVAAMLDEIAGDMEDYGWYPDCDHAIASRGWHEALVLARALNAAAEAAR